MPRGKNKRKKKGQSSAAKGRNSALRNYASNRNRGPHQSRKDEINDTLERASYLANSQLHQKNNYYEENYVDDHGYNNNRNGGGRRNKKNKNQGYRNNNNNHNGKGNKGNNKGWKQKGGGRKSEIKQFLDQLRPLGLGIRNAQSDGNCLFRAISDQISGDENNQGKYRKDIVTYMRENSDEFAPFYVGDYNAYLTKMSKNGIWGGNMELTAAAKAFEVDIVVHRLGEPRYEILYQKGTPKRTIHISYHNERHYASVRRLDDMRSDHPAKKINLDKTESEQLQREQQRAEIAWCHNGGNPLDIESAKDELMNLNASEQIVVARTGCYDITIVQNALLYADGDIEAAIENIQVEMSMMAEDNRKKTMQILEKQKEEEEKEEAEKNGNKNKDNDNDGGKKKKKKNKHKKKKKNKGNNNNNEKKKDNETEKKPEEKDEEKDDEKMSAIENNTKGNDGDNDNVNEEQNEEKPKNDTIHSAKDDTDDLEARLAKMQSKTERKGSSESKENNDNTTNGLLIKDNKGNLIDPFSVSVKVIPEESKDETSNTTTNESTNKITTNDNDDNTKSKDNDPLSVSVQIIPDNIKSEDKDKDREKKEDINTDLDKKDHVDISDESEQKKGVETESNENQEPIAPSATTDESKLSELEPTEFKLTEEDIKCIEIRDERINKERINMNKIKCIDPKCSYQNELLLSYLYHYRHNHLSSKPSKPSSTIEAQVRLEKVQCPCGHLNEADFSFCSECGWDLRFKVDLPKDIRESIKKENEYKKQQRQKKEAEIAKRNKIQQQMDPEILKKINFMALGTANASALLNTGGRDIVIRKNNNNNNNSNNSSSYKKKKNNNNNNHKGKPNGDKPLEQKYAKYLNKYWKCKNCGYRNLKEKKTKTGCMVCNMLNIDNKTMNAIKKAKKSYTNEDFPALSSKKGSNNSQSKKGSNPLPPPPKPSPNPAQKKKNEFGWICPACTMENKPKQQKCHMCNSPKPKKGQKNNNVQLDWECTKCTMINAAAATKCGACDNKRPGHQQENKSNDVYHAAPHYYDDQDVKDEIENIKNPWEEYKDKNKKHNFDHDDYNDHNGHGRKRRDQQEEKKQQWQGGGKCSCGSGKKYKKCCKKLQKHQDKRYKNKFKNPDHEANKRGYHNDNSYHGNTGHHQGGQGFGPMGTGHEMVDELDDVIEKLEWQIANFKGKNAKQEKKKMERKLDALKRQRDQLYTKNERERDRAYKARNRAQQRDRDREQYGYIEDNTDRGRNRKGGRNNNHNHNHRGNNNGFNNNGYDNSSSQAAANIEAANKIIAI